MTLYIMHLVMAVLASWRITELFTQDRITASLRVKYPTYLWQCPRCMSVWAGAWAALIFALAPLTHNLSPWLNWPFALAWLYLVHLDWRVNQRVAQEGRQLVVAARGQQWTVTRNDFNPGETQEILAKLMQVQAAPHLMAKPTSEPDTVLPPRVNGVAS